MLCAKSWYFCIGLSYCRQLKTVRTHLSGLVISLMPDEETIEINEGMTECVWDRLCPQGVVSFLNLITRNELNIVILGYLINLI